MAGRLAESGADVLLFEAGTNADELTQVTYSISFLSIRRVVGSYSSESNWNDQHMRFFPQNNLDDRSKK